LRNSTANAAEDELARGKQAFAVVAVAVVVAAERVSFVVGDEFEQEKVQETGKNPNNGACSEFCVACNRDSPRAALLCRQRSKNCGPTLLFAK